MHVDLFSLTANNVTYGAAGDFLQYWRFYPTGEEGWGRVPVSGLATAVESRCAVHCGGGSASMATCRRRKRSS